MRRTLYKLARILGDYEALKRGRLLQRLGRRYIGGILGKRMRRLFR